jgi:hypothetical protein
MGNKSDMSDDVDLAQMVAHIKTEQDLEEHLGSLIPQQQQTSSKSTTVQRSVAKAIPTGKPSAAQQPPSSQPSSMGSSGSGFISGMMNSGSSGTGLLSHTPPTQFGTSYEAQHFGKRPRAGVSVNVLRRIC